MSTEISTPIADGPEPTGTPDPLDQAGPTHGAWQEDASAPVVVRQEAQTMNSKVGWAAAGGILVTTGLGFAEYAGVDVENIPATAVSGATTLVAVGLAFAIPERYWSKIRSAMGGS